MQPTVSIIIPCYNEQATIGALLAAIQGQSYPADKLEIVIADGFSEDGTRAEVARFQRDHPSVRAKVVDNHKRTIPSGLNQAIRESSGQILVRLDAHSIPIPEYVERCVQALETGRGANVGGVWQIVPGGKGALAAAIAAAAAHPLGAGDALYRLGGQARAVDTVPFGAFRRDLVESVGPFDEDLLTNEDYEFNYRLRRRGNVVWMDPEIRSTYVSRSTLQELARQYWRYGFWKYRMLLRYPESIRWRQALPPLFILVLLGTAAAAAVWPQVVIGLALVVLVYLSALLLAGVDLARRHRNAMIAPLAVPVLATMHFSWGLGFLWSVLLGRTRANG
ncbi:MAG TPA: glycosyltransferase family 2 protein [Anaerolineales bacterium]|nr:glycosyltransferase family 2 protein [Anaerolineales bacterium]